MVQISLVGSHPGCIQNQYGIFFLLQKIRREESGKREQGEERRAGQTCGCQKYIVQMSVTNAKDESDGHNSLRRSARSCPALHSKIHTHHLDLGDASQNTFKHKY